VILLHAQEESNLSLSAGRMSHLAAKPQVDPVLLPRGLDGPLPKGRVISPLQDTRRQVGAALLLLYAGPGGVEGTSAVVVYRPRRSGV